MSNNNQYLPEHMASDGYSQSAGDMALHDLEAHIDELRKISNIRKKSAEMRTCGHKGLLMLPNGDTVKLSLYEKYKLARMRWRFLTKDNLLKEKSEQLDCIERLRKDFLLETIASDQVSVLTAAEAMRAFTGVGYLSFSQQTMKAWYFVIREIYTAVKPDWCIGGARAGDAGWVTAYSTAQCVRALCDLAEVLERTCEFLRKMQGFSDHMMSHGDENIPAAWRKVDKERLTQDVFITLSLAANKIAFNMKEVMASFDVENFLKKDLQSIVSRTVGELLVEFPHVRGELKDFIRDEDPAKVSMTGHTFAMDNIELGFDLAHEASILLEQERWMEPVAKLFQEAAKGVRLSMKPSRGYLSSVIDRQLAISSSSDSRSWEPSELAYAVSAYALTVNDTDESTERERLKLAAALLHSDLSADGTLPSRAPFHTSRKGILYIVHTEELLGAVAEVFRAAHKPVDERLARSMFHYFGRQCKRAADDACEWFAEFDHQKEKISIIASIDAVESLGAFNRMLDEGINEIILDHFFVREPKVTGLGLNDLFYPDYGFSTAKSDLIRRNSIALTMQEMRAHVVGVHDQSLCSLVLHGPGGTGKTMLIEALANTCNVKLIEVTPSDIAKGGEADIEKRARAVFEALSMLSHVVILFDEFDPVLKRRDGTGKDSTNIFSFLTPGMLPKLKALHDSAKDRKVAYALITNLIGTLDIPAIRKGRFDKAVGIYPPDPLSRAGYIARLCRRHADDRDWDSNFILSRFMEVVAKTSGVGMTSLTEKGNFSSKDKSNLESRPIGYIYGKAENLCKIAEPEATFNPEAIGDVVGQFAIQEYMDWGSLVAWDKHVSSVAFDVGKELDPSKTCLEWLGKAEAERKTKELHVKVNPKSDQSD